ncbi:MAG: alcohol dehydrogenase [Marmoricola sp.]|nr:alcohol dehydrogenase [Marmoricola sp.]
MRALVIESPAVFSVQVRPDPTPDAGEVIVAVRASGICGTDLHLLDGELPYDSFPVVPGHEFFGEIVAVGAGVDSARIGGLVAVDPNLPCHRCSECRRGRTNLCLNYAALGVTLDGGCAELVKVPAHLAYDLPAGISEAAALLIEPLACAIHGFDVLPRNPNDRYLVYGAGTMGLLMSQLAADLTGEQVDIVEPNPVRRQLAEQFGHRAAAHADDLDPDSRWDTVIDCTGVVSAIEDGLTRVRRGGTFQCFGVADQGAVIKLRPFEIYRDEITIVGSMAVLNSFDRATTMAESWGDRLAPLVTHQLPLDGYADAVEVFRAGSGLKISIRPNERTHR